MSLNVNVFILFYDFINFKYILQVNFNIYEYIQDVNYVFKNI